MYVSSPIRPTFSILFFAFTLRVQANPAESTESSTDPMNCLTTSEWEEVERSVDRALEWICSHQEDDGRFPTLEIGQPAVTSLCVLALLSRGHLPGEGEHGKAIDAAIAFTLSCQKRDGLLALKPADPGFALHGPSHTGIYNHAISALMLSEVYGMTARAQKRAIRKAIQEALRFTRERQVAPKGDPEDRGGWRYLRPWPYRDSDLSVTGWQLLFLRSAKNAGFHVPAEHVDEAMEFVERCFDKNQNTFVYSLSQEGRYPTRGMVGSGILALSLGGRHNTPMARASAEWILKTGFEAYNRRPVDPRTFREDTSRDRYHYGAYYCTQAMFQLGGDYWDRFFPPLVKTLLRNQDTDGSWDAESGEDFRYGNVYTTSLTVLSLCTPYQLLPIYQR